LLSYLFLNSCLVRKVFFVVFTNQREAKDIPKKNETRFGSSPVVASRPAAPNIVKTKSNSTGAQYETLQIKIGWRKATTQVLVWLSKIVLAQHFC
jgi:hypothetical protein